MKNKLFFSLMFLASGTLLASNGAQKQPSQQELQEKEQIRLKIGQLTREIADLRNMPNPDHEEIEKKMNERRILNLCIPHVAYRDGKMVFLE